VSFPTVPKPLLALNSRNVFFNYSAFYASKNGRTQDLAGAGVQPAEIRTGRSKEVRLIDESFEVDDKALSHFFEFLEKEGITFSRDELLQHRDRLALLIKAEIFSSIWGEEARQRVYTSEDPQVRAGLEAMPDTVELLADPKAYVDRMTTDGREGR
jgi:hypothetical protein